MKSKRRDFLKVAGLAGIGMLGTTRSMGKSFSHVQRFNMSGYGAPGMDIVRVGIIGVGQRGPTYINTMGRIEGVELSAICDLRPEKAEEAKEMAKKLGHHPFVYSGDKDNWKKLCERDDIDLVIVTTPWTMHAEMGLYAMNQ